MKNKRAVLPDFFTLTNVFLGFLSIIYIADGRFTAAAWFITFAAFCDALDGRLARLSGAQSKFGVQLDSLADAVSFGIAPAFLIYTTSFSTAGLWGVLLCFIFVIAGIFRLARYNITPSSSKKKQYYGLPIPVAALTVTGFYITAHHFGNTTYMMPVFLGLIPGLSLLMVSNIEYETLPSLMPHRSLRKNLKPILYLAGIILFVAKPRVWYFPLVMVYVLAYLVKGIIVRTHEEEESPQMSFDEDEISH